MKTTRKETAAAAYSNIMLEAVAIADRLGDVLREQYPAPDPDGNMTDWGWVGSVGSVRERLAAVERFILGTED